MRAGFWTDFLKRALDLLGAVAGLLLGSPLLILIAVLIKVDSPGPVLFRQRRVGRGGKPFDMLKFRTMRAAAGELLERHLDGSPTLRLSWEMYQKLWEDPRLTRVGRWLRRSSLDELPQLWNVLRGEMSLVGPRPFYPEQRPLYGPAYVEYIRVRPGITGLWQVSGRNRLSFAERAEYDQYYVRHRSLWMDLVLLARTVKAVLQQDGAF